MNILTDDIIKLIVLRIDPYTTYEASKVCKRWFDILLENYDSIDDENVIYNDTFMFVTFLSRMSNMPLDNFLNNGCIKKMYNSLCIKYLCNLMILKTCDSEFLRTILKRICKTNKEFPIKLYEYARTLNGNRPLNVSNELLGVSLIHQSYNCIDYLMGESYEVSDWIYHINEKYDKDSDNIKEMLSYLIKMHYINLKYLKNKLRMKGLPLVQYIEENYY